MHKWVWNLDDSNTITLTNSAMGTETLYLNERVLETRKSLWKLSSDYNVLLPDGRNAEVKIRLGGMVPVATLFINQVQIFSEAEVKSIQCPSCALEQKSYDKFCQSCGAALPSAALVDAQNKLKQGRFLLFALSGMHLVAGIVFYAIEHDEFKKGMKALEGFADSETFPNAVNGVKYTAGELKRMLSLELNSILAINVFLAVIMAALGFWATKKPFPAVLVGASVYVASLVLGALVDPGTIAQGIWVKIFFLTLFYQVVKAGFGVRNLSANG